MRDRRRQAKDRWSRTRLVFINTSPKNKNYNHSNTFSRPFSNIKHPPHTLLPRPLAGAPPSTGGVGCVRSAAILRRVEKGVTGREVFAKMLPFI